MEKKKRDAELKKDQVGIEKLKEMCVVLKIFCIYMVKTVLTRQIESKCFNLKKKRFFTLKFLDSGTS